MPLAEVGSPNKEQTDLLKEISVKLDALQDRKEIKLLKEISDKMDKLIELMERNAEVSEAAIQNANAAWALQLACSLINSADLASFMRQFSNPLIGDWNDLWNTIDQRIRAFMEQNL